MRVIYLIENKHIMPVNNVAARNPRLIALKNIGSFNTLTLSRDKSNPIALNNPIITAANGAPGIPNNTVGIMLVAFWALLLPSGPITPLMLPLPNYSFGLDATVVPYANQSLMLPPSPGSKPITDPMNPPRIDSFHSLKDILIPSITCW